MTFRNGYEVIAHSNTGNHKVILCERVLAGKTQYVTARWEVGCDEWFWGHYFDNKAVALCDYTKRCRRFGS